MKKALYTLSMILMPTAIQPAAQALAVTPDHYAASSRLAEGRWARVRTTHAGMNIVTDAELRRLGFTDPTKVHVYGLGGRELSYGLNGNNHDDLPQLPSVRTAKGIVFFATDHFTWKKSGIGSATPYSHTIHPYSDDTYYFLSDRAADDAAQPKAETSATAAAEPLTTFMERLVHEKEIEPAADSGSQVYGEDFRSKKSQTFSLPTPGNAGDNVTLAVRFAAKSVGAASSLALTANGKKLPATNSDRINSSSMDAYCQTTTTIKEVDGYSGDKLDLTIDFTYGGTLFKARLDYIEVFYERDIALSNGEIHFYGDFRAGDGATVRGCSAATRIWDVTDPAQPLEVEYSLSGDKASFTITGKGGYREFVAFNPEAVTHTAGEGVSVENQDLHAMETPDMLIISHPEYMEGARRIAALHERMDGMRVAVLDPEQIYREFSGGKPDFQAFRRLLKMWYDRGESADGHRIGYCLLMGRPSADNKMLLASTKAAYKPMLIWQSYDGLSEHLSYSNDDLIGMLDDCRETEFQIQSMNLTIPIGRIPVTDSKEALEMAAKIEKYCENPTYGPWRNRIMLIADDDDRGDHLDQAQAVYNGMRSQGNGTNFVYDRLYLDQYPRVMTGLGPTYPQATERMMRNYNDGVILTDYIGHANPTSWGHEHLWDWGSITSMTNKNLTFIIAATCRFGQWDQEERTGAEYLMLNPDAGVIGMMVATRTVVINSNGLLNSAFSREFFKRDAEGRARRLGDIYIAGKNNAKCTNSLKFAFMGDPAIRVPSPELNVRVESIDGTDVTAPEVALPEVGALSTVKVEGCVTDDSGAQAGDFNGTITLQLYDAERVITTLGQGSSGQVRTYNDRDRLLAQTTANVTGGRWSAVLRVPPEIQGNYSPAMIAGYAWSDKGREANGTCESLYVYGYGGDSDDTEGPAIESFYANNPENGPGAKVNANPVIFATLRDKSGINISQSGIGHSLTITIDGSEVRSDVSGYFTQDAADADLGRLVYPLTGVTPGRHTLTLTAWDNANNVSKADLEINVGAAVDPAILDITALFDNETSGVDFVITTDRPNTSMECSLGIYDLSGRKVWSSDKTLSSDLDSVISTRWDLCDSSGSRVPRGIYIYRATVETPEGTYTSKSKKIAVGAPAR